MLFYVVWLMLSASTFIFVAFLQPCVWARSRESLNVYKGHLVWVRRAVFRQNHMGSRGTSTFSSRYVLPAFRYPASITDSHLSFFLSLKPSSAISPSPPSPRSPRARSRTRITHEFFTSPHIPSAHLLSRITEGAYLFDARMSCSALPASATQI